MVPTTLRAAFAAAALTLLVSLSLAGTGHAAGGVIQPGDEHDFTCTLNFVYDGVGSRAGEVYIGTAAHCVSSVGQQVSTRDFPNFGTVAYLGDEDRTAWDFALIRVKPQYHADVSAAVKGHPNYPTGYTTPSDTFLGDAVQISGYGMGYGWTTPTQEERVADFMFDDQSEYGVSGPIHWGDSGGPLVHIPTGKALGIVSRLCLGVCTEEGPTVQGILAKSAANGFPIELRTV
ncbi:MAG: trypsin-like peptidase domain-containing protein [Thermoplasmatota archaeon]